MPLQRLEHYLVLSDDIHRTRDFYRDVLGMVEGFRPDLDFPGFWLYLGDTPCIHVAEWKSYAVWTKQVGIPVSSRAPSTPSQINTAVRAWPSRSWITEYARTRASPSCSATTGAAAVASKRAWSGAASGGATPPGDVE